MHRDVPRGACDEAILSISPVIFHKGLLHFLKNRKFAMTIIAPMNRKYSIPINTESCLILVGYPDASGLVWAMILLRYFYWIFL